MLPYIANATDEPNAGQHGRHLRLHLAPAQPHQPLGRLEPGPGGNFTNLSGYRPKKPEHV